MGQGCTLLSNCDMHHGSTGQGGRQLAPALLGLSSDPSSPNPNPQVAAPGWLREAVAAE